MDNQQKRARVYDIFQTLAPRYDRANARISLGLERGWKKLLVNRLLAGIGAGEQALDVCCGTGDIAIALADGKAGLRVTGLDFSPAMLAVAKEKGEGRPDLHWVQGDAMQLPFPDGTFGAVCISFGLRNTPDYRRVLREMKRVVRPGGKVYCLDSFVPDMRLVRPFYRFYFRNVMPLLGGGLKHLKEYRWLYLSTESFLRAEQLVRLFRDAGLEDVCSESRMFGACVLVTGCRTQNGS